MFFASRARPFFIPLFRSHFAVQCDPCDAAIALRERKSRTQRLRRVKIKQAVRAAFDHAAGTGEPPCAFWLGFERNAQAPWDQLQAPASGIFCFRPRSESLPAVLRQGRREHANSLRRKRQIPLRNKERCIFRQALFQAIQQRTVKFRRLSQKIKETALRAALGQCVQRRLVRQPFRYDRVVHHAQRLDVQIGNACASIRKNAAACERTRLIFRNCYNFFTICGQIEGN